MGSSVFLRLIHLMPRTHTDRKSMIAAAYLASIGQKQGDIAGRLGFSQGTISGLLQSAKKENILSTLFNWDALSQAESDYVEHHLAFDADANASLALVDTRCQRLERCKKRLHISVRQGVFTDDEQLAR